MTRTAKATENPARGLERVLSTELIGMREGKQVKVVVTEDLRLFVDGKQEAFGSLVPATSTSQANAVVLSPSDYGGLSRFLQDEARKVPASVNSRPGTRVFLHSRGKRSVREIEYMAGPDGYMHFNPDNKGQVSHSALLSGF